MASLFEICDLFQKNAQHIWVAPEEEEEEEESNPVVFWRLLWSNGSAAVNMCCLALTRPNNAMPYNVGWHDCCTFCFAPGACKTLESVRKGLLLYLFVMQGDAGGPILIESTPIYDNLDGTERARPDQDIVVGVISYANYTALKEIGIGCMNISSIYGWIQEIAFVEVPLHLVYFPSTIFALVSPQNIDMLWQVKYS